MATVAVGPAAAQQEADFDGERRAALLDERKGDFDYLLGEWRFTSRDAEWGEGRGYWTAVRLDTGGGSHILDEYRLVGDHGETYYVSTTLRAYNAARDAWDLVSVDHGTGLQDVGVGRKVGDEMHIEQRFGVAFGSPDLLRIRYYDIRPDRFSWVADRSRDDGATWESNQLRIEARRIGPARSIGPLAPPRSGGDR
jgi:hypothetical protein